MLQRSRQAKRAGTAAVELAFLAPLLVFLLVIGVDWARVFYYTVTVNDCSRNGAAYLADPTVAGSSPYASYSEAALAGTSLSPTPTVTSREGSDGNGAWVEVTVAYPFKTVTNFPGVPSSTTVQRTIRMTKANKLPT